MKYPAQALSWEIWQRSRGSVWLIAGTISFCWFLNLLVPDSSGLSPSNRERILTVEWLLAVVSFLFVFGMFNHTEFDPRKEWTGFPYRLFVLPVPTWLLVLCPILLGVVTVELVYFAWVKLLFSHAETTRPVWFAVLL